MLGYFLCIVYGSLVPLHYQHMPLEQAIDLFRQEATNRLHIGSRSDFVANAVLYVPLSFLVLATVGSERRWLWSFLFAPLVILFGAVTSIVVEFMQLYFPPRTTSWSDVVANTIGSAIGAVLWLAFGQGVLRWCRLVWTAELGVGLAGLILPAYLLLLFALSQLPPDLTLSPVELYHKYQRGMVRLVPFAALPDVDVYAQAEKHLWNVAYFHPVGLLLAFRRATYWRKLTSWPQVFGIGLLTTGAIEAAQLFNMARYFDASDIVSGSLSILGGWTLGVHSASRSATTIVQGRGGPPVKSQSISCLVLLGLVWLGVVLFVEWHPFRLRAIPQWPDTWLPFSDYYQQRNFFQPLEQLVRKTSLFLPGGILLALAFAFFPRKLRGWRLIGLALLVAAVTETGQLVVETRYFSITDILVETNGAWLGSLLTRRGCSLIPNRPHTDGGLERHLDPV